MAAPGSELALEAVEFLALEKDRLKLLDLKDDFRKRLVVEGFSGGEKKRADDAQLVITHYQRLLNFIIPDFVHVLVDGRIVKSGGKELAFELEAKGYEWILNGEAKVA